MDPGVDGAGEPFAVGHALGTERPQDVEKSHAALGPGHRAHRGSDAADRWGEAVWESLVCAVSSSPAHRQTRATQEDVAQGRQSAAQEQRLTKAQARAQTAEISSTVSRASRYGTAYGHYRDACQSSGSLPYVAATTRCGLSQAYQHVCQEDRTTARTVGCVRDGASLCPRALSDPSSPGSGLRDAGLWLRAP